MAILAEIGVSKMSGKLTDIGAINTNTLTNSFCLKRYEKAKIANKKAGKTVDICGVCYSVNMLQTFRKSAVPAFQRNTSLAERILKPSEIPNINQAFFRFSGHGELITDQTINGKTIKFGRFNHIENLCLIAERNDHCTFALWTKRTDIIKPFFKKRKKPANLILVWSNPKVDKIISDPPPYFDKVFNNISRDSKVPDNCSGQKCKDCLKCYKKGGTNVIIEKEK